MEKRRKEEGERKGEITKWKVWPYHFSLAFVAMAMSTMTHLQAAAIASK